MNVAEEAFAQVIFADAGGNAHIADGEGGGEGVMGLVNAAALEIVPQLANHFFAEGHLFGLRKMPAEAGVVCRLLGSDGLDDGHLCGAQIGKETAHSSGFHAVIGEVNQGVGNVFVTGEEVRQFAAQVERLFEIGLDFFEVIRLTGLSPDHIGFRSMEVEALHEVRRDAGGAFVIAAGDSNQAGIVIFVGQTFFIGTQVIQQFANGGVDEFFLHHA
jgi:hypothetical protein